MTNRKSGTVRKDYNNLLTGYLHFSCYNIDSISQVLNRVGRYA
jgi:hypothetical protein